MDIDTVYLGDALDVIKTFPDESIDCCVTSPPYYGLRDYGVDGQIGLEESPDDYIGKLVELFREIRRCLKKDGTIWVNLGDSYAGNCSRTSKGRAGMGAEREGVFTKGGGLTSKQLMGIPWRFAFAMQADGWYLRQDIIWAKPNPMPESVTDRCTKSHEYIFLLSKSEKYYFDQDSILEPCADQYRTNYASGNRTNGVNADRNDNDLGERSKDWMPKVKSMPKFGGNKYGDNSDPHFQTYSGKEWQPRTKNCQYDGQRPNSFHLMREEGKEWEPKKRYGSGTKVERTHEQGYSEAGGHRDNSGGFDSEIKEKDGVFARNKRDVWIVSVKPNKEAHFATYPPMLIQPCILAGCPEGGIVLDPFMGSGTTGIVANKLSRHFVGVELNPEYQAMATRRIANEGLYLF